MHLLRFMLYASCWRSSPVSKNTSWQTLDTVLLNILSSFCLRFILLWLEPGFFNSKETFFKLSSLHTLFLWGGHPTFLESFPENACWLFGLHPGFRWGYSGCQVMWPSTSSLSSSSSIAWRSIWGHRHVGNPNDGPTKCQPRPAASHLHLHSGNHTCINHLLTFLGLTQTWQLQPKTSHLDSFVHSKNKRLCPVDRPREMFLCNSSSLKAWFTVSSEQVEMCLLCEAFLWPLTWDAVNLTILSQVTDEPLLIMVFGAFCSCTWGSIQSLDWRSFLSAKDLLFLFTLLNGKAVNCVLTMLLYGTTDGFKHIKTAKHSKTNELLTRHSCYLKTIQGENLIKLVRECQESANLSKWKVDTFKNKHLKHFGLF